jgi:phosphoribosylglycinamide formyltransferase-1
MNIAVLVSGGGTNLQALIDTYKSEGLGGGELSLVISSRPGVQALERAQKAGIRSLVIERKKYGDIESFDSALCKALDENNTGLVVLAGFLSILGSKVLNKYQNKIINVHPALIPSFCGKGFYGLRVHEEALKYGVKVTGATVHLVNEVIDGGKILLQKAVDILPGDTPEVLQQRVMKECEWVLLPKAVAMFCRGDLS